MRIFNILAIFFLLTPSVSASTCGPKKIPLEKRAKQSEFIFLGKVLSQEEADGGKLFNSKAEIEVTKVYKGDPGDRISIFYFAEDRMSGCQRAGTMHPLTRHAKLKLSYIFFVQKRDGVNFTAREMFDALRDQELAKQGKDLEALRIKYKWR